MANHFLVENTGVHLHALIARTECDVHKVPTGIPCYHIPNNMNTEAYYVGACGSRIRSGGFNGKISPQSMRTRAPGKQDTAGKKPWVKKPNTKPAAGHNGIRSYAK